MIHEEEFAPIPQLPYIAFSPLIFALDGARSRFFMEDLCCRRTKNHSTMGSAPLEIEPNMNYSYIPHLPEQLDPPYKSVAHASSLLLLLRLNQTRYNRH